MKASGIVYEENFQNARERSAGTDDQFEDVSEIAGEENERKDADADQGVSNNLSEDVAGQNPHARPLKARIAWTSRRPAEGWGARA